MALVFTAASSQSLAYTSSSPVTAVPLTIAAWVKPANLIGAQWAFGVSNSGSTLNTYALGRNGGVALARAWDGVELKHGAAGGLVAGDWTHFAGYYDTDVTGLYLNGSDAGFESGIVSPTGLDLVHVGRRATDQYWDGSIAELGIWSVVLAAQEVAALYAGVPPSRIRPSSLVFYAPLWGIDSPEPDLSGGNRDLTLNNTPVFGAHAPVSPLLLPQSYSYYSHTIVAPTGTPAVDTEAAAALLARRRRRVPA